MLIRDEGKSRKNDFVKNDFVIARKNILSPMKMAQLQGHRSQSCVIGFLELRFYSQQPPIPGKFTIVSIGCNFLKLCARGSRFPDVTRDTPAQAE
jgi:hypothetical protein